MNANRGYVGWSMSVRASEAYGHGLMPWADLTAAHLKAAGCPETFATVKRLRDAELITAEEWHHTSKMFNETDFWSVESIINQIAGLDNDTLERYRKPAPRAAATEWQWVRAEWREFPGRGRRTYLVTGIGVQVGGWVFLPCGKKNAGGGHITVTALPTPQVLSVADVRKIKAILPAAARATFRARGSTNVPDQDV